MLNDFQIGVVVPALNEEDSIVSIINELCEVFEKKKFSYKILVVDDGSTDNTSKLLNNLKKENLIIHRNEEPQGIGAAYKLGMKKLNSNFITWIPSDGEISPQVYEKLPNELDEKNLYLFYPSSGKENRSFLRRYISRTYIELLNFLFRNKIKYYNANTVISRQLLSKIQLNSNGFTISAEVVIKGMILADSYTQIPFTLHKRNAGEAKAISLKNLIDVFLCIIQLYFRYFKYNFNKTGAYENTIKWK